jgi:predicted ABC-type exoprotein transport system permease subunit
MMFKLSHFHSEDMALALIIWLCTLPLIAFIVAPLFGMRVAGLTALALFIAILAACWGVCGWKLISKPKEKPDH